MWAILISLDSFGVVFGPILKVAFLREAERETEEEVSDGKASLVLTVGCFDRVEGGGKVAFGKSDLRLTAA